ncbi:WcbI family polysaccharide biosynthesis putative acetyltransferase [Vibrio sp. DNB22_17_1]
MTENEINTLRDSAIKLIGTEPKLAYQLLLMAYEQRPSGPKIRELVFNLKNNFKSVIVIGNCQATPLSNILTSQCEDLSVLKVITAHTYKHDSKVDSLFELSDYIITQPLSSGFGDISTEALRKKYKEKVVTYHNLFYKGFHQDWTYLPTINGQRLSSPIGDYHNQTILDAFVSGKPVNAAISSYSDPGYNQIYNNIASESLAQLFARENSIDIKFCDFLEKQIRSNTCCFHTFNHPKKYLIVEQAKRIADYINIKFRSLKDTGEVLDRVIMRTNPICKTHEHVPLMVNGNVVDVPEFARMSFDIYHANPEFIQAYKNYNEKN